MATCSTILPWEIPWTEEPGGLQSMGSQRVGHDLAMKQPPPTTGTTTSANFLLLLLLLSRFSRVRLCATP